MSALRTTRLVLWALVAVLAIAATGVYIYGTSRNTQTASLGHGDYQLVTASGEPFNRQSLDGHPSALFFGFTHCPDVCPTTLADISLWYKTLGDEAKDLKAYFISVDPERDTPEFIGEYVSWEPNVTGVTGSRAEIDKAIRAWAVHAEKVPLDDGEYNVDHTASVFLLNRRGEFEGTIAYQEAPETAVEKLKRVIAKP